MPDPTDPTDPTDLTEHSGTGIPGSGGAAGVALADGPTRRVAVERRRMPAGRAVVVVLAALVVAAGANGESLVRAAERQPFGVVRDVTVPIARAVDAAGSAVGLDAPRRLLQHLTGRSDPLADEEFGAGVERVVPAGELRSERAAREVGTGPPGSPRASDGAGGASAGVDPGHAVEDDPLEHRVPTEDDPLRVLILGDSLAGNLAVGFGRVHRDPRMHVVDEFRVATGLARPDVLDWPSLLAELLAQHDPEVVVMVFGANDDQDMQTPDGRVAVLTPSWIEEYARRAGLMMDLAGEGERTVVWLGLPVVDREGLEHARRAMNHVTRLEAGERPRVRYVELADVLTPEGVYSRRVSGVVAREADGVHLSIAGAELVAPMILDAFAEERRLG